MTTPMTEFEQSLLILEDAIALGPKQVTPDETAEQYICVRDRVESILEILDEYRQMFHGDPRK